MVVGSPIVLNLVPGGVMKMVHVNQADKNIDIQFQIMNGNQPYNIPEGWTGTIRGTKGDAFGYSAAVTVTAGSNVVTVHLKEQLTAVAGFGNIFELVFASTSAKVSTENFILAVERSALNDETVISESDLVYANQVLNQLQSVAAVNQQVLQNKANIATETATRAAADTTLQNNINAEATARQAADNTLQSNINAEASTRATADASLQSQIDQLVAPSGEAPSAAEVLNARIGADGVTYPTLGDMIRTNDTELKSHLNAISPYSPYLVNYLYKLNTYIDANAAEATLNGYDLFKIPVNKGDVVFLYQVGGTTSFWQNLADIAFLRFLNSNNTYTLITTTQYASWKTTDKYALVQIPDGVTHLMVSANTNYKQFVRVAVNNLLTEVNGDVVSLFRTVQKITSDNTFKTVAYKQTNGNFANLSGSYFSNTFRIHKGDVLKFSGLVGALTVYGAFTTDDNVVTHITTPTFIAPSDGMVNIMAHPDYPQTQTLFPADSIKLDFSNILNVPDGINAYDDLTGVAFGTSLTYRSQTTGGFLSYLETLSGISFDNQGLGSSTILAHEGSPQMLPVIQNYSGWTGKRVCLLEGFCNDWYYNGGLLGTWKDTGTATVCGCVRTAITHILTQNPNLTVFLILDHFGKGITAPSAVNSENETQFEWYEELAKLGRSMGIRVIREYELSEISNLTPQFLLDNIHLNALGAEQSARAIWSGMKGTYPNLTA